jgi:hypothetical protein
LSTWLIRSYEEIWKMNDMPRVCVLGGGNGAFATASALAAVALSLITMAAAAMLQGGWGSWLREARDAEKRRRDALETEV